MVRSRVVRRRCLNQPVHIPSVWHGTDAKLVHASHCVPDGAKCRERDVQIQALELVVPDRVLPEVEVQLGEHGLDERVARGGVRAPAVDVRDEEKCAAFVGSLARVRIRGG